MFHLECIACIPFCGKQRSPGKFHISHLFANLKNYVVITHSARKYVARNIYLWQAFSMCLISLPVRLCSQELFLRQSPNDAEHWYTTASRCSTFSFILVLFLSVGVPCQNPSSAITYFPPGHSAPTEKEAGTIVNSLDKAIPEVFHARENQSYQGMADMRLRRQMLASIFQLDIIYTRHWLACHPWIRCNLLACSMRARFQAHSFESISRIISSFKSDTWTWVHAAYRQDKTEASTNFRRRQETAEKSNHFQSG